MHLQKSEVNFSGFPAFNTKPSISSNVVVCCCSNVWCKILWYRCGVPFSSKVGFQRFFVLNFRFLLCCFACFGRSNKQYTARWSDPRSTSSLAKLCSKENDMEHKMKSIFFARVSLCVKKCPSSVFCFRGHATAWWKAAMQDLEQWDFRTCK